MNLLFQKVSHWRSIVGALLFSLIALPVGAQGLDITIDSEPNYAALAVGVAPDYIGSDDYEFVFGAAGRYSFDGYRSVELLATQLTVNLLDHENWRLGPTANYRFGRDDVDDDAVDRLRDVDDSVEVGFNVGYEMRNALNPRYSFSVGADFLQDVSDGHDGYLATLSASYWMPVAMPLDLGFGVSSTYASDDYHDAFFSVDASDSARSGLDEYSAGSGVRDVAAFLGVVFHFSPTWHAVGGLRYQALLSDAKDSPIVDDRGSSNQFVGAIGLAYSW